MNIYLLVKRVLALRAVHLFQSEFITRVRSIVRQCYCKKIKYVPTHLPTPSPDFYYKSKTFLNAMGKTKWWGYGSDNRWRAWNIAISAERHSCDETELERPSRTQKHRNSTSTSLLWIQIPKRVETRFYAAFIVCVWNLYFSNLPKICLTPMIFTKCRSNSNSFSIQILFLWSGNFQSTDEWKSRWTGVRNGLPNYLPSIAIQTMYQ